MTTRGRRKEGGVALSRAKGTDGDTFTVMPVWHFGRWVISHGRLGVKAWMGPAISRWSAGISLPRQCLVMEWEGRSTPRYQSVMHVSVHQRPTQMYAYQSLLCIKDIVRTFMSYTGLLVGLQPPSPWVSPRLESLAHGRAMLSQLGSRKTMCAERSQAHLPPAVISISG